MVIIGIFALICLPTFAAGTYDNTYYGQEGNTTPIVDGYLPIIGVGPYSTQNENSINNWIWQGGSSSWEAIYSWDGDAWLEISELGDGGNLDVEADIEMYIATTILNHKMYFHIGNIFTAMANPNLYLRAFADETIHTNHPMWIGISFDNTPGKTEEGNFITTFTDGKITDAMVGKTRLDGSSMDVPETGNPEHILNNKFDATILCSINGAAYGPPSSFGDGAHGTLHKVLWWGRLPVNSTGVHYLSWLVQLHPKAAQQDGNYHLDPVFVSVPEL